MGAKFNLGKSSGSSRTIIRGTVLANSTLELNIGDRRDQASLDFDFTEVQQGELVREIEVLRNELTKARSQSSGSALEGAALTAAKIVAAGEEALRTRRWNSVTLAGLMDAAKTVGSTASPLVATSMKVLELLSKLKS